jgi:hypothetical protein
LARSSISPGTTRKIVPKYKYLAYDVVTQQQIAELPLGDVDYEHVLNRAGGFKATLSLSGLSRRRPKRETLLELPGAAGDYASTPWVGSNPKGLYLPGTSGHYAGQPDHASLDFAGDHDIRARLDLPDWTPAALIAIFHKHTTLSSAAVGAFNWSLDAAGTLTFQWSDGAAFQSATSTVAVPGVPGTSLWVRAVLDVDNGAAGRTITFYTSTVENPGPSDWTVLGAPVVQAGVTQVNTASTVGPTIGANVFGTGSLLTGLVRRVQVRNGIEGAIVLDVDFTDESQGWAVGPAQDETGVDATGKVVTIRGASSTIRSTLDVTGDLDLRVYDIALDDWTPPGAFGQTLVARYSTTTLDRSVWLRIQPAGDPLLVLSTDGSVAVNDTPGVVLGIANGETLAGLRVTWRASDGRVEWFTLDGSTWTPLGAVGTIAIPRIHAAPIPWAIGARLLPEADNMAGTVGRVEIRDGIDGTVVASSDFTKSQVGNSSVTDEQGNVWTVNGAASIVENPDAPFQVGGYSLNAIKAREFEVATRPRSTAVYIERDGQITWGGFIWRRGYASARKQYLLEGAQYWSIFHRRMITDTWTWLQQDQTSVIVADLIEYAQSKTGGALGVMIEAPASGRLRDETHWFYENKYVGNVIEQMTDNLDGFDFALIVGYDPNGDITHRFETYYPRRGRPFSQTSHTFEYGKNLIDFGWPEEGTASANSLHLVGAGEGTSMLRASATDAGQLSAVPLLETGLMFKDITVQQTLNDRAAALLGVRKDAVTLPLLIVRGGGDPPLGGYICGDEVRCRVPAGVEPRFPDGYDGVHRIGAIRVSVPDNHGDETVTITAMEPAA